MAERGNQTEKPTQRRLDRARREGHFPASREFPSAVQFLGFLAFMAAFSSDLVLGAAQLTRRLLAAAFRGEVSATSYLFLFRETLPALVPLFWGGCALVILMLLAQLTATRMGVSFAKLRPSLERLGLRNKLGALAGQNGPALVEALVLLALAGAVLWWESRENLDHLLGLVWLRPEPATTQVGQVVGSLLWRAGGLFLVAGLADLAWQRRRYLKQLRMSKQEIREEVKEQEGNPQIKMRIRRIQRDLARRQMMKEIPKATAVIVNPTHYAVALRYELDAGSAPRVVAKGKNYLAGRIRQKAIEHQVPIVENPPLARALYSSVEVGQEIPSHLYRAVAEILAYIYRLMNGRLPG